MNDPQDFQGLIGDFHLSIDHAGLIRAVTGSVIPRGGVPGAGHHRLVVGHLAVFNHDPMAQRTARRLYKAHALGFFGPSGGVPFFRIRHNGVAAFDVGQQLILEVFGHIGVSLSVERPGGSASQGGGQPFFRRYAQHFRDKVDLIHHHFFQPRRLGDDAFFHFDIDDNVFGQRPYFGHLAAPFRRLNPGVLALFVKVLPIGLRPFFGSRILRLADAVPRMQFAFACGIFIPRMSHAFGDHRRVCIILRLQSREGSRRQTSAEVFHHALGAQQQVFMEAAVANALKGAVRHIANA